MGILPDRMTHEKPSVGTTQAHLSAERHWQAGRTLIATMAVASALVLSPPVARAALTGTQGVAALNAQRAANGIPGDLQENPVLSEGCRKHQTQYVPSGSQNPHSELTGQPGYSPDGDAAASSSDLAFGAIRPWTAFGNPWTGAPIHLAAMFDPAATTGWYGEGPKGACLGTGGDRDFSAPSFFSYPGNGTTWAPAGEQTGESPFTPAEAIGLPGTTGPNIIVWATGLDTPVIAGAALTDAAGVAVPLRWADSRTPNPGSNDPNLPGAATLGGYGSAGYVIPAQPLHPNAPYQLLVNWTDAGGSTYPQTMSFRTAGRDPATSLSVKGGRLQLTSNSPAAVQIELRDSSGAVAQRGSLIKGGELDAPRGGGQYQACFDQPATGDFASDQQCQQVAIAAPVFGTARRVGRKLIVPVRSNLRTPIDARVTASLFQADQDLGNFERYFPRLVLNTTLDRLSRISIPIKSLRSGWRAEVTVVVRDRRRHLPTGTPRVSDFYWAGTWTLAKGRRQARLRLAR